MEIELSEKFEPLINEVSRYYIITGERMAAKSFAVGLWSTYKMLEENNTILFTRWTLSSTEDSIIPEFNEKIELLGIEPYMSVKTYDIKSRVNNSKILFRGIKTSQGIQTAKLKSLTNVNIWILDEAEELVDEDIFDKIDLSVRFKDSKNIVILVLNPAPKTHWIYKRFFKDKVPENFNGTKDNVTYIYTTLEDNIDNIDPSLAKELLELKKNNPEKYKKRMSTSWMDEDDTKVFKNLNHYDSIDIKNAEIVAYCDIADQGIDYLCFVVGAVIGENVFILDVVYSQLSSENTEPMVIKMYEKYNISKSIYESNNQGMMYMKSIIKDIDPKFRPCIQPLGNYKTNKHTRIIMQSDFILENFYFKNTDNKMYNLYLDHLTSYKYDKSFKIDDAPDATAGLSRFIRNVIL